jgi:hypothetical protein
MMSNFRIFAVAAVAGGITAGAVQSLFSSWAVQNEIVPPTTGIYTGVQFSQLLGDAFRSIASGNKGATAPANVSGAAVDGLRWIDDSATPWLKKTYVNGGWATEGAYNPADSSWVGLIGGGTASIASASTTDLGSLPQANVTITGTTTITSFGSSAAGGILKIIRFDNALVLTHSSSLRIPNGGFPLTTAADDRAIVTHLGSGAWEVTHYTRANGIPLDISRVGKPSFDSSASVSPLEVQGYGQALSRASYPAYLSKVTRAQNGTRISGNATITSVSNTVGLGAGMPVEGMGIQAGCTIATIGSTSITLNSSSCVTSSGTSPVTVFITGYGTGGSSSTVGVPDCRGRGFAGRDHNTPGTYADLLTVNYFGRDANIYNVSDGREHRTLLPGHLPVVTPAGSVAVTVTLNGSSGVPTNASLAGAGGVFNFYTPTPSGGNLLAATATFTGTPFGNNEAHPTVQPTRIHECTYRVVP